ncbi:AAA family ATPase [filamentous cyanobacterium LEGE 11480]|uniref:AAA family ATPase n=1 Tax=Romeriopsis navalis LEGE 11480 TaxID=2777977 RepID=A0A928Z717_9CYAN|nr:NB-ARC domain-containing protein [Romeriopsis navalis]MBE9032765.1 AAA family ATPase [Romeriopsis navalis LEGE 11480]
MEFDQLFLEAGNRWNLEKLYGDLATAKQAVTPHKKPGLTAIEQARTRGLLLGYSPAEIAQIQYATAKTVEVALSQTLYRYVEVVVGRDRNSLSGWRDVADWLQQAGYRSVSQEINWNQVPDVAVFYGRETELQQLQDWMSATVNVDRPCRVVAICGPGGIGKTTLTVQVTQQLRSQFECVIWQSLRHAPSLEDVLQDWLSQLDLAVEGAVHDQISVLLEYLRCRPCLIVLDNLDSVSRRGDFAGHYQPGYEAYGDLLRRLGEEPHQSCLLLNSREATKEIVILAGPQRAVRCLDLEGLGDAAAAILREASLSGENYWKQLIRIYRGNPLVLKIVASNIREMFDGSVTAFLKQRITLIASDISYLVEQQVQRLSAAEQTVLYRLSESSQPIDIDQLNLQDSPESFQALGSLLRRSLIEKSVAGFTLRPVVMEYVRQIRKAQGGDA